MLFFSLLAWRDHALRPKDHHQNKNQAEHHALIFRRLELRGELAQGVTAEQRDRDLGTRLAQTVEPKRQAFEQL